MVSKEKVVSRRQRQHADTMSTRVSSGKSIARDVPTRYDLAELTTKARKRLKTSQFAVPSKRSKSGGSGGYPVPDASHARNALARVSQFGTPAEKAAVKAKVAAKFPNIGKKKVVAKRGGK